MTIVVKHTLLRQTAVSLPRRLGAHSLFRLLILSDGGKLSCPLHRGKGIWLCRILLPPCHPCKSVPCMTETLQQHWQFTSCVNLCVVLPSHSFCLVCCYTRDNNNNNRTLCAKVVTSPTTTEPVESPSTGPSLPYVSRVLFATNRYHPVRRSHVQ